MKRTISATTVMAILLASCTSAPPATRSPTATLAPVVTPTTAPTEQVATPAPSPTSGTAYLPSAGGTCSSDQIVPGASDAAYGFGTAGTQAVYVRQFLWNNGPDCVLREPTIVAVAPDGRAFVKASAEAIGTEDKSGNNAASFDAKIAAGHSLRISIGAWWWIGVSSTTASPIPSPQCAQLVDGVTTLQFPVAEGSLMIKLPTVFKHVCTEPASISIGIIN